MIIHNKIKHKDLEEQITQKGVLDMLASIRLDEIEDDSTRIIARTLLYSYETFIERISKPEEFYAEEETDKTVA